MGRALCSFAIFFSQQGLNGVDRTRLLSVTELAHQFFVEVALSSHALDAGSRVQAFDLIKFTEPIVSFGCTLAVSDI